ncbi:MAG: sigma-70 family RNA polymerase sigma factor [Clostridiales bacterium]|nr:sigma-70 family RNA polymerase sigma factor [Clostridiales bacterium]
MKDGPTWYNSSGYQLGVGMLIIYLQMIETPEEKSKFERLYLEYRGLMYHVAYEILHNEQDAEDAVHQAFVKIAENIKKIDDPVCPKTHGYVVTIVENKAIDQYRKRQKIQTVELIDEIHSSNVRYDGENALASCILELPPRYREMILLRYHHGYSVREIANMMEISLPAAIKLDQRAKNKLREICKKEGIL